MKLSIFVVLLYISFISCDNYAVLVAGSNTYINYRHQADVFHHYQILIDRGFMPENIITFAYDDIAYNPKNPIEGKIYNSPKGKDVYAGVIIDYIENDVTPENFIAAITGDEMSVNVNDPRSTAKVLTSTENDNVYIYFSDHGLDNSISFPNKFLYADELNDALLTMHEKKMYKELVFYMEACHSGSMFQDLLPKNISIYVVTAANPRESSFAEYCGKKAIVNGVNLGTCLGDEFSSRFMEDIESRSINNLKEYTIQKQFDYLDEAVLGSHVQQYGDLNVAQKSIFDFITSKTSKFLKTISKTIDFIFPSIYYEEEDEDETKINNENYRLEMLRIKAEQSNELGAEDEYYEEIAQEARVTLIFNIFNKWFILPKRNYEEKVNYDCYRKVVKYYEKYCGLFIDRDFKFMTHIVNFCTKGISHKKAKTAFKQICE